VNIIIETERKPKGGHLAMLIEDNGTQDGGRIVGTIERYEDAVAICKAMGWKITEDAFQLSSYVKT
jgi:hypothetical protein